MQLEDADEEGSEVIKHFDEEIPSQSDRRSEIRYRQSTQHRSMGQQETDLGVIRRT